MLRIIIPITPMRGTAGSRYRGQSTTLRDAENGDITIKEGRIYTQEE